MPPKLPNPKNIPVPSRSDAQVQEAANQQRQKIASEGVASNWLTGGLGVKNDKLSTVAAQLLGGG